VLFANILFIVPNLRTNIIINFQIENFFIVQNVSQGIFANLFIDM
jgi:hypothetical protein